MGILFRILFLLLQLGIAGLICSNNAEAAPRVQKLKPSRPFTIPMRFDVVGDGVELLPLELEYDLSSPGELKIGKLEVNPKTFFVTLLEGKSFDTRLGPYLSPGEANQRYFVLNWPELLIPEGQMEMISRSGRVVWSQDISAKTKKSWQTLLQIFRDKMVAHGVSKEEAQSGRMFRIPFAMPIDSDPRKSIFASLHEPYRFCLSKSEDNGYSRLCSALYETVRSGNVFKISLFPVSTVPPRVIALNKEAGLKDTIQVKPGQLIQFFAELESGLSYEFIANPRPLNLVEMSAEKTDTEANLIAWGSKPMQGSKDLNADEDGYLVQFLGFQQTIGDFRNFWQTKINLKHPLIYIPGVGGGCFKQKFIITKLPHEELRPFIHEKTIDGTYVDGAKIFGRKRKDLSLSSTQNSAETDDNQLDFTWRFGAANRGELNKSYLVLKEGDQEFRAYHEVFKGYPREFSARTSGIISTEGKLVFMGEMAFQYWFEDFFGWTNYYVARQRWGLNMKYFQSLSDFTLGNVSKVMKITTADLKYRLTPGLWNRDETWGAILGTQHIQYSTFDLTLYGGGAFWARSMPKVFDDFFNNFWFMKYPKWVDVEFIYYLLSTNASIQPNFPTYALNFHGKVMWTNSFFGEAGFGIKQYNVDDRASRLNLKFGSLYGTAGIGFNF